MGERVQVGLSGVPSLITRWKSHRRKPCVDLNIFVTERFLCFWRVHGVLIASILTDSRPALQCASFCRILRGKRILKLRMTSTYQTHWWAHPVLNYVTELITPFLFWHLINSEGFCVADVHIQSYLGYNIEDMNQSHFCGFLAPNIYKILVLFKWIRFSMSLLLIRKLKRYLHTTI